MFSFLPIQNWDKKYKHILLTKVAKTCLFFFFLFTCFFQIPLLWKWKTVSIFHSNTFCHNKTLDNQTDWNGPKTFIMLIVSVHKFLICKFVAKLFNQTFLFSFIFLFKKSVVKWNRAKRVSSCKKGKLPSLDEISDMMKPLPLHSSLNQFHLQI